MVVGSRKPGNVGERLMMKRILLAGVLAMTAKCHGTGPAETQFKGDRLNNPTIAVDEVPFWRRPSPMRRRARYGRHAARPDGHRQDHAAPARWA
jgi:hypothetical protein